MACNKPILRRIKTANYEHYMPIPCGYCAACRRDKIAMWSDRIGFESDTIGRPSAFVTLTYEDVNLPSVGVSKEDVQKFLKRLRYHITDKIKYYVASEYGLENENQTALPPNQRYRPHYHILLLGFDIGLSDNRHALDASWSSGFITADYLNSSRIRYCLKYLSKELVSNRQNDCPWIQSGLNPLFHLVSKGLGKEWFYSHIDLIKQNNGYYKNGKLRPLPRYYQDLLRLENDYKDKPDYIKAQRITDRIYANTGCYWSPSLRPLYNDSVYHDDQKERTMLHREYLIDGGAKL